MANFSFNPVSNHNRVFILYSVVQLQLDTKWMGKKQLNANMSRVARSVVKMLLRDLKFFPLSWKFYLWIFFIKTHRPKEKESGRGSNQKTKFSQMSWTQTDYILCSAYIVHSLQTKASHLGRPTCLHQFCLLFGPGVPLEHAQILLCSVSLCTPV